MEVKEIHRKKMNSKPALEVEEMIKNSRKEHSKLRKGMFEFLDAQGGWLEFSYRWFPGEPIQTFKIYHGEICELPMGIIKHLNNTVTKIRVLGTETADGKKRPTTLEKKSRIRFTPMDVL